VESAAEFNRVCFPLFGSKPGFAEESRQIIARSIHTTDVNLHYFRHEVPRFDPWSVLAAIRCPVLVLAGEDDPICPLPVVEELARRLPADTTRLVRLPRRPPRHLPRPPGPGVPCRNGLRLPGKAQLARALTFMVGYARYLCK
jgi:hypothetical protein